MVYRPESQRIRCNIRIENRWISLGLSTPIPSEEWTHVAYSWDGTSGEFREFLNGVETSRDLPSSAIGMMQFASRKLIVGSNPDENGSWCNDFVGMLDEVRMYSHARSGRSICLTTYGTQCITTAIKDAPTMGQYVLSNQDPGCDSPMNAISTPCLRAYHRVCAQVGTSHALSSVTNLWKTIKQLVGFGPPVSLAGYVTATIGNVAKVSCAPMPQKSVAVTFGELKQFHSGCLNDRQAHQTSCLSASHRFCQTIGWDTGIIFEVTTRAWITCFQADKILEASDRIRTECGPDQNDSNGCRFQVNALCQDEGYDAGLLNESPQSDDVKVHCFHASSTDMYDFQTTFATNVKS